MEYTSDKIGRTTAIGNATGLSQSSFATGISYRAFGGVKSMTYSTGAPTSVSLNYDNRLRLSTFEAESSANAVDIQNKIYTYTDDGSIKQATNAVDSDYSQTYAYDFAARLKKNDVGGLGTSTPGTRYKQTLGYDAFDNFASRQTWDGGTYRGFTNAVYADNRKTSGGFDGGVDAYDAAGNIVGNTRSYPDVTHWKFDVAGRVADWDETSYYLGTTKWDQGEAITFDGDGRAAKREKRSRIYAFPATGWSYESEYYITSSVTGQALQLDENGNREKMSIHMGTAVIAEHSVDGVAFKHTDPVTGSEMQTTSSGEIEPGDFGRIEREPLGAVLPTTEPELNGSPHNYKTGGTITNPAMCSGKEQEGQGRLGPMPCKPSQAFTNYLTDVYGFDAVSENFQPDVGLGGGGVGADNEPLERRRIRGLSLVRDRNGFAIRGFDFRVS